MYKIACLLFLASPLFTRDVDAVLVKIRSLQIRLKQSPSLAGGLRRRNYNVFSGFANIQPAKQSMKVQSDGFKSDDTGYYTAYKDDDSIKEKIRCLLIDLAAGSPQYETDSQALKEKLAAEGQKRSAEIEAEALAQKQALEGLSPRIRKRRLQRIEEQRLQALKSLRRLSEEQMDALLKTYIACYFQKL